jgi:integrase
LRHGHYLQLHGHQYRFRMRFPKGLVNFKLPGELIVSLRTDSYPLAVKRARFLRVSVESLMNEIAKTLCRADAEQRVRGWIEESTERWETNIVVSGGYAFFDKDEADKMGHDNAREMDDFFRVLGDEYVLPRLKSMISNALSGRDPQQAAAFEPLVSDVAGRFAPEVDLNGPDGAILARTVLRGFATILDDQSAITSGEIVPIPRVFASPIARKPAAPVISTTRFLDEWDKFEASKIEEKEWKRDTGTNARSSRNLFGAFYGDLSAASIDRRLVGEFRSMLFKLPSRYDKAKIWRGRPLADVIAEASTINARTDVKPSEKVATMKLRTVDKHFNNLVEYWNWMETNGLVDEALANPFKGFIQPKAQGKKARKERDLWPDDMVTTLFTSPVWTGCSTLHRRGKPGHKIFRDARFWVPLFGRLVGAREDEICSLNVGDIVFIGGIAAVHIFDGKTDGSERDLPIPELLLIMGFLEHRFYGRDPSEPLFPELLPQGVEGRRSGAFSGWFTEYRKTIDCYQLLVDFHSFRHNVSTDLENMEGLNLGWADEITGHESDIRTSERSRYNKGVYMRHLKATIDRIDIGVNLDHLAYEGKFGVAAPGARQDITMFTALAEREMELKARRKANVTEPLDPGHHR